MGKFLKLSCFLFILFFNSSQADVIATATESGLSVSMKNNTDNSWTLGGIRFENGGYVWTGNDNGYPVSYWAINDKTVGGKHLLDLYFKSNAPGYNTAKLNPAETRSFSHPWASAITGAESVDGSEFLLLRTGSSGVPDDPIGEDAITISQLDSLILVSKFYDPSYRYDVYDSLGVRGGKYSGGFMDTWLGETQIQFPIPPDGFNVNMTPTTIDTVNLPKMYWMALALAQEYMNVDMQWMGAMASKESFSGTTNHLTADLNQGGVYTPWHVENSTGLDRAMAYPVFFPKYQIQLASAGDVTSSGVNPDDFLMYYCRAASGNTVLNSATTVSAIMVSITVQYNNYDVFAAAADICWKEALEISRTEGDPFMGLAAMVASYNLGQWGQIGNVAGALGASTYEANSKLPAPLGRDLFPTGNGDYRNQIINVAQAFTDASRQSLTDNSITLLDFNISKEELLDVFFGDNGTVATQGDGGLLRNFFENDKTVQRQEIWNTVSDAFDKLKEKSPSTTGAEAISYRYDFLSILRTVKGLMSFKREFRAAGDASILIPQHSAIGGCSNVEVDDIYPYLSWTTNYDVTTDDYIVTMTVEDEIESKDVKWTLAYDWSVWNTVSTPNSGGSMTTKSFDVVIPKADVEFYRSLGDGYSGYYVWIMGNDLAGNSTIKRLPVPYKSPQLIDSVAAYDTNGDGDADLIKAYIEPGGNTDISNFDKLTYQWTTTSTVKTAYPSDGNINVAGKIIEMTDNFTEGVGIGEFSLWVDTAYGLYDPSTQTSATVNIGPKEIIDRVGPVIDSIPLPLYIVPENASALDTLKNVTFSEPIKDLNTNGTYLQFKNGSGSAVSETATAIIKVSSTEYTFIFPNGTLASYTDVKILSSSELQDEVGNKAADNNQWVPISKQDKTDPSLDFASVKDSDGDGYGDNFTYKIIKGSSSDDAFDFGDISELKYKWNQSGTETSVSVSDLTITGDTQADFDIDTSNGDYGSGSGDAYMYFVKGSDNYTLTGKIIDSVGPAIISAEYVESKDSGPCTLTVILTEDIEDAIDAGTQYLVLGDGTKISQSAINKKSEIEYEFLVTAGTISDGDQVQLIHNSGLTDASNQKNPPLENNILQDIVYIGATIGVSYVEYYDTDADGVMDKVIVTFKSSVDQTEDVDNMSFVINWLDEDDNVIAMNVAGSDFIKIGSNQIEWKVNSNNFKLKKDLTSLNGGYGNISITQPNENTGSDETENYGDTIAVDKMAPVLVSAEYYDYKGAKDNELNVTYSENVNYVSSEEPFDFFDPADNSYDISMELVAGAGTFVPTNKMTFTIKTGNTPSSGDKLNIDHEEGIVGEDGNAQKYPENKYVNFYVLSAIGIQNASYHDITTQRDGYIDEIRVRTDSEVPEELFDSLAAKIVLNAGRNFGALSASDFSSFTSDSSNGFVISVKQAAGTDLNTAVSPSLDKLEISSEVKTSAGFIMNGSYGIIDSIAPVIVNAVLSPVEITKDNYQDLLPDTLKIVYSEAVVYSSMADSPLKFKMSDGSALNVDHIKEKADAGNFVRYLINYNSEKPKENDSVQIDINGTVSDNASITQQNDNVFVPISVDPVPFHWNIGVYPNPVLKNNDEQVSEKKKNLSTYLGISEDDIEKGMQAVVLDPLGPAPAASSIDISITIYDALGHRIVDEEKLEVSGDGEVWYFLWDGQNEKGRDVGSGIYLGYIKISPEELGVISDPLKLGVGQ